ncbi:MAG: FKBP-type peptidyl-prolyl cis-trans isomerase [bacterium]
MNTVSTGIAVALALAIMAFFFLPGPFPFHAATMPAEDASADLRLATSTEGNPSDITTNQNVMTNATELQIRDIAVGTGPAVKAGDAITVNYVGMLADGTVFDASANHSAGGVPFTIGVGQVIPGWDQGLIGMKVGGKRELVIPASLAYGSQGAGSAIPPNATLIFEIELLKIGN